MTQAGDFLLWDNNWTRAYRCSLRSGDLIVKEALPVSGAWFAFSGDAGDLFYTHEDLRVCRWNQETGQTKGHGLHEKTAIGRRMRNLG